MSFLGLNSQSFLNTQQIQLSHNVNLVLFQRVVFSSISKCWHKTIHTLETFRSLRSFPSYKQPCLQNYSAVFQRKESLYFEGLQISLQESHEIEEQTREQSKSPYWIKLRKNRLTASKVKRVAARNKDFESLVGQLKRTVKQTEAMKYGLVHEGETAMIYADFKAANIKRTGFVIIPGCPLSRCKS